MARLRDIRIADRTADIAQAIAEDALEVQAALIELDDDGMVIMRNGWYLASHKGMKA